jgi:alpha-glucosidase
VKDVIGKRGWPAEKGRDGERTPMQWDATVNAGFNTGATPWLPVNPNFTTRNAASERQDPGSMLNWYRDLIRLRRTNEALSEGAFASVNAGKDVFAYLRIKGEKKVLVVLNMSPETKVLDLSKAGSSGHTLLGTHEDLSLSKLQVEAFGVRLIEVR